MTIRTVRGEMWLTPDGKTRRLVGGIIARYQEILGIEIYAYNVLSNHYHFLIRAPKANADEFAENVNREIARRVNWRYGREGALWSRRYAEQQVLDEEHDLLEAFLYINLNPTRHGLLKDSALWGGLNSYHHALTETDRIFTFTHYASRNLEGVPMKSSHRLRLSVLPHFRELSKKQRRKKIKSLLLRKALDYHSSRGEECYLGEEAIKHQVPGEVPREMSRSPRPSCYTKSKERLREFLKSRRLLIERYALASRAYRLGELLVTFPSFTFTPPRHRLPRLVSFEPLTIEQLKIFA